MLSMPPATTSDASPARMAWSASITAFKPEPQTLLTVNAPTESGNPAKIAACRAGFWPSPAPITLPMMTSLIDRPVDPVRSRRALMQAAPSLGAGTRGQGAVHGAHRRSNARHDERPVTHLGVPFLMCSSLSWRGSTVPGAPVIRSVPLAVLGKAMQSRILVSPE